MLEQLETTRPSGAELEALEAHRAALEQSLASSAALMEQQGQHDRARSQGDALAAEERAQEMARHSSESDRAGQAAAERRAVEQQRSGKTSEAALEDQLRRMRGSLEELTAATRQIQAEQDRLRSGIASLERELAKRHGLAEPR